MSKTAFVTGGAGFIGSHCCRDLLDHGFSVVLVDNFVNSSTLAVERIRQLGDGDLHTYRLDISDERAVDRLIRDFEVDVVVHFAAHKAVGESVNRPLEYYTNNLTGLISLLNAAHAGGVRHLIFSSSCSIYGDSQVQPISEASPARPANPYARSKWMAEIILEDMCHRYDDWSVTALRYFNPAGAHPSGILGEDPVGPPKNIFPFMAQLAAGRHEELKIFGSDYPTPDGTPVRDYIHVLDVVEGHRLALEDGAPPGFRRFNLGTGRGTSVLELVSAFEKACGSLIPYRIVGRRPGDVPRLVASPERAMAELGWQARRSLEDMCTDSWRFQQCNPAGYGGARTESATHDR